MTETVHDVIIIGGSYAGLSAATQLARARRDILIIDEGLRRNRFTDHSHGFLTQDGVDPSIIAETARQQVLRYPTVKWLSARADTARKLERVEASGAAFEVSIGEERLLARRLLLATGVKDILPDIEGLAERWGKSVFHCPYCHGYELNQRPIGVLATSALSMHHGLMLPDWGPTTFMINESFEPDPEQLQALADRGTVVELGKVRAITGSADVDLTDGRKLSFEGIFALAPFELASAIAQNLGLEMEQGPVGSIIKTDPMKETSMRGVFACGDAARLMASVALAVGDGNLAGAALHRSLMFDVI